ncbi:MAG TPA: O-antigen polymerase [Fimbriimonadaceae bacterium]|nr:O-antigen polymerase [Fimbriimonadaceae bacterium]
MRRLAPMVVIQIYLWITLGLFAFGPWQWPLRNPTGLYTFLFAAHIALLLGYLSAGHKAPSAAKWPYDVNKMVRFSLWINLLVLPITSYARTGNWIPNIVGGLTNPGEAYGDAHMYAEGASNGASYLRILVSPALVMLFPLGVYLWKRLTWGTRVLLVGCMLAVVAMAIATGQRRDMADLLITVPFIVMAAHCAGVSPLKRRTLVIGAAGSLLAIAAFAVYFTYSHVSRVGKGSADSGANPITLQAPDVDNPMLAQLPDDLRPGMIALLNYLTTGYYGLGLSIDRDVKPMYGFGHSMFLTRTVERLTGDENFESRSLPVQISDKDGFKYPVHWCTAYPYFANDLGFFGTVVMLFFVGRALAQCWIDMLGGRNPYAVVFFALLMTLVFYLPATNRMLQDGEGVIAFYGWLAVWLSSRLSFRRSPVPVLA